MLVAESEFGEVGDAEPQFYPGKAAIQGVFRPGEEQPILVVVRRQIPAVAVGVGAELGVTATDIADIREGDVQLHLVVAARKDRMGIENHLGLSDRFLDVHVIDSAEHRPGGRVLLLELRLVAAGDQPAEGHVDPVVEKRLLLGRGDGLGITGLEERAIQESGADKSRTELDPATGSKTNHVFHLVK